MASMSEITPQSVQEFCLTCLNRLTAECLDINIEKANTEVDGFLLILLRDLPTTDKFPKRICRKCHSVILDILQFQKNLVGVLQKLEQLLVQPNGEQQEGSDVFGELQIPEEAAKMTKPNRTPSRNEEEDEHLSSALENLLRDDEDDDAVDMEKKTSQDDASSSKSSEESVDMEDVLADIGEDSLDDDDDDHLYIDEGADCSERTTDDSDANDEAGTNPTKRSFGKFVCTKCPRRFVNELNLKAHLRSHDGLLPFNCDQCDRGFVKANRLKIHKLEEHSKTQIKCHRSGCGKVFRRVGSLKSHIRKKHDTKEDSGALEAEEERPFVCERCGRRYKHYASLKEHRYTHANDKMKPYQCDQCERSFVSHRTYKEHLLRHTGVKNFECPHCGLKKTTKKELDVHVNYHTKERQWPCEQCPTVFNSSANLGVHMRVVHKGLRRFACRFCDRSFGKADTLKHHEMRHTGEKPHVCDLCDKRFIQIVALKAHLETHQRRSAKQQTGKVKRIPKTKQQQQQTLTEDVSANTYHEELKTLES